MRAGPRLLPLCVLAAGCGAFHVGHPAAATSSRAVLRRAIDSLVSTPEFRNANWGILIVDPGAGETLYAHNAPKLFMPASNMKLVTSATALEQLGPDFRYRTTFATRGRVADSTLDGDLLVIGRGDPTVSDHMRQDAMGPLRDLADSLRQHGINRITGRMVATGDAFPGPVRGYGWPWDQLDQNSFAGVDELLFNEGLFRIIARGGGQSGDSVRVETHPARTYPSVRNSAVTVAREALPVAAAAGGNGAGRRRAPNAIAAFTDTVTGGIDVTGQIAAGDSTVFIVSQHDPDTAYLAALKEALQDRGIAVDGQSSANADGHAERLDGSGGAVPTDTLFVLLSPPLSDIMPALLKPSQNQIAEALLRTLGLERAGVGTADSGRKVEERQLATWGVPADGFLIRDGSGLSRNDYLSPEAIVQVLEAMRHSPNFQLFYQSLPIAGVDGTIRTRMRGTPAERNLHAKTGTLSNARSLSGYVTTADSRMLEFSILCNNWTAPQASVDRVADAIGVMLAQIRLQ